jgi:predicted Zn-dependent protease
MRVVPSFISLASGLALAGALELQPTAAPAESETPRGTATRYTDVATGTVVRAISMVAGRDDDRAETLRKLRDGSAGTYISEILHERDSSLARWADRNGIPLTVWIQPEARIQDFAPSYVAQVRQAFQEWDALYLPIRFSFVHDSADAEVHVNWVDRFKTPISGRTRWARDEDWVITDANITLAMHHHQGEVLDEDSMRAMALHEIGHLLGLDHTRDSLSIMAPRVRVRALSAADRATVRLLYALPTGPIR